MSGIVYRIVNLVNGKFYVGSTVDQAGRFRVHRKRLNRGTHHSKHLQAAWQKYGATAFAFEVVEHVAHAENLRVAEQRWLDAHVGSDQCYNFSKDATAPWRGVPTEQHPQFGVPKTEEHRQKIAASLRETYAADPSAHPRVGRTHTEETKERIRQKKLANPSRYWQGKTRSEETKAKISAAQKGVAKPRRELSPEGRSKIQEAAAAGRYSHWLGRTHTEESRAKMSRMVRAVPPTGEPADYTSITALREATGLKAPTVHRALNANKPLTKGPFKGWRFEYLDPTAT
jgi:group I intron endonuclease